MTATQGHLFGGNWTEEKLDILAGYLVAYNTALKKQSFRRIYIDAFAGTGYRQQRQDEHGVADLFEEYNEEESQAFLKGSAKRAFEVSPPFDQYILVESDADKVADLKRLRDEHPEKADSLLVVRDDANSYVQTYCREQPWQDQRAVLFLDPFATEVEWTTIEAVASTQAVDVWILFPQMAVNRLLANDPQKACKARLDRVFGTDRWYDAFYRTRTLDDIFGEPLEIVEKACDTQSIGQFFRERLRSVFAGVAKSSRVFRNSRGGPLFQFFFAAANPKGAQVALKIASHLLEKL